jgi:PAS domain S-box-containing protein
MAAAGGVLVLLALMVTGAVGRGIVLRRRANELALQDELDMRRRIDAELRASRQRLQDFSSSSADWFWETGVDGRFTYLSDNFETTIGRYKEQLLGRTRAELLADDGLNPIEQVHAHAELLRRQQPFRSFEYRLLDGAGSVRWLSTSGLPVVDGDGQFAGYRGAGQDVTARRNAEGALEQGHRLLREAVENVASGFTIYDPQDRLVICNATYLDIYATSRDLIQPGARFEDIVRQGALRGQYPQAQGRVDAWVAERVRLHQNPTGRPIEQALDDGRWLLIVETRTPSGYIVGNRIDITDRKKAEAEVRKLSLAIEQCPASIFITDLQGRIEYANEAFVSNTGYPLDEVLGRKPSLLKSGQTPEATYRALWLALAGKQTWKGEFHNRRKDGSVHIDAAIVSPIHQADGRVSHYLGIQEDVTESRRQAEELERHRHRLEDLVASRTAQLVSALDAAQAASLAKSQFLANMSHEIRTPLNAISGLSHLIRRSGVNPEQATRLAKIETASRHLLAIISAILDLSKIEAGKLVLDDRELDLAATVGTVISMVSVDAAAKHIELRTDIDALPWRLRGDETRLQQALLNYVANAVKFTEAGSIDISLRGEAEQGDAVLVRFEVCDTGIGIAPDQQAGLFSVFQQADNSMTRRHGGTGLGLAITRRFAELMGGSAGLSSRLGQGSTFWFTARLMKAGAAVETTAPMPLPDLTHDALLRRDFSGRRVLLVEDNPVNQEVMIELLRDLDLTVELARDGVEAITMAETGRYDLMLMDMQMPRMGGMQATQRIRQLPACATLPILALTGNAFVEDRARCLEAGMNDFITKPIDPDSLAATLLHWLGRA